MDPAFFSIIALFSFKCSKGSRLFHITSLMCYIISRSLGKSKIDFQSMHALSESVLITNCLLIMVLRNKCVVFLGKKRSDTEWIWSWSVLKNFFQSFQPSPKKSILSRLCCKSPVWVYSFGIFPVLGRDFLAVIQTLTFTPSPHSGFNGFWLHLHAKSQVIACISSLDKILFI